MDLREKGWEGVNWFHLTQDTDHWWALVNMAMNVWVDKTWVISWVPISFSRRVLLHRV
jgi:hypothetical protein